MSPTCQLAEWSTHRNWSHLACHTLLVRSAGDRLQALSNTMCLTHMTWKPLKISIDANFCGLPRWVRNFFHRRVGMLVSWLWTFISNVIDTLWHFWWYVTLVVVLWHPTMPDSTVQPLGRHIANEQMFVDMPSWHVTQPVRPTKPLVLSGTGNEYRPRNSGWTLWLFTYQLNGIGRWEMEKNTLVYTPVSNTTPFTFSYRLNLD